MGDFGRVFELSGRVAVRVNGRERESSFGEVELDGRESPSCWGCFGVTTGLLGVLECAVRVVARRRDASGSERRTSDGFETDFEGERFRMKRSLLGDKLSRATDNASSATGRKPVRLLLPASTLDNGPAIFLFFFLFLFPRLSSTNRERPAARSF